MCAVKRIRSEGGRRYGILFEKRKNGSKDLFKRGGTDIPEKGGQGVHVERRSGILGQDRADPVSFCGKPEGKTVALSGKEL